jgi:radical SAM superfamily enzyme YgiQ (UPF0313 family)
MKITFIRLNMFADTGSDAMKPLLFEIIKQATPAPWTIEFLDERVEPLPPQISSEVIAFSVETYTAKRAYLLAKQYKRPGNVIAMGGFHASVMPEEMLRYADTVLMGDAEDTWGPFLADCLAGRPKKRYVSQENLPLQALPGDPSVYRHRYHGIGVCQISRGCKFHCEFCSIKTMYQGVRRKSPDAVYQELKQAKEKFIFFVDDNLFYDRESALALFRKIAPLRKKWACQISMDAAKDEELLAQMKKAGCFLLLMGFESLNPASLKEMGKQANLAVPSYQEIIRRVHRHHMLVYATFVLGCDGDGTDVFERTYRFAVENKVAIANFNPLIPMPGTETYRRLESEGRLLYRKWWLSDRYRYGETAFLPRNMTPEQLRDGCLAIRTRFYGLRCILGRLFSNPVHLFPSHFILFLLANLISRREIRRKQGKLLGGMLHETDFD